MFRGMMPVTRALVLASGAGFLLQLFFGDVATFLFGLWPLGDGFFVSRFHVWQLVSYAFLHGSFTHLAFNMFALYMFGSEIERLLGGRRYFIYYIVCVIGAAVAQLLVLHMQRGMPVATVGASGGVFGLLLAYGLAFPRRKLILLFPPIPMPAWLFVTLYGLMELFLGVTGTQAGVAHFAHLGGMVAGFLLILVWRARPAA
jgi:membrane associated rhomboid family serine protease